MRTLVLAAALVACAGPALADDDDEHMPNIRQMGFLTGAWSQTIDGITTEEHWVGPIGGVMAGVSITHSDKPGFQTSTEFMSIVESGGTLVFIARPGPEAPTEFRLKESDNGIATFENEDHDFPQRITYEIDGDMDVLKARIEGVSEGRTRAMEWTYRRQQP
ncbi:MAG: DUF6265 family protein [Micropepsaceae bacterium]